MGPILALGIVVMMAVRADAAAGAAGGARPARVLARDPARAIRSRDAVAAGGASRRLVQRRPRAAGRRPRSRSSPRGALGNLGGRGYLDLVRAVPRPAGVRARAAADPRALRPPGRVAPLDVVARAGAALEVRDALRSAPRASPRPTPTRSRGRQPHLARGAADVDPFSRRGDGPHPAAARGRARGRAAASRADRRASRPRTTTTARRCAPTRS